MLLLRRSRHLFGVFLHTDPQSSSSLPVLVLGYNRPEQTRRVIQAVQQYKPSRVYLACDGPKIGSGDDRESVEAVRAEMKNALFECEVLTRFEESNRGIRMGVIEAIDWFFQNESEGIILEDDCLPGPDFFRFCESLIIRYRQDKRVWGIGGYNATGINFQAGSYGFIRFAMIWGWATWADRWFEHDRNLVRYQEATKRRDFLWPSRGLYHGLNWHLKRAVKEPLVWSYPLSWSVVESGGHWALPDRNLVINLGFGKDSTNTRRNMFPNQQLESLSPYRHPANPVVDEAAETELLRAYFRVYRFHILNYLRNGVRWVKIYLKWLKRRTRKTSGNVL